MAADERGEKRNGAHATLHLKAVITHKDGDTDPVTREEVVNSLNEITTQLNIGATAGTARTAGARINWSLTGDLED